MRREYNLRREHFLQYNACQAEGYLALSGLGDLAILSQPDAPLGLGYGYFAPLGLRAGMVLSQANSFCFECNLISDATIANLHDQNESLWGDPIVDLLDSYARGDCSRMIFLGLTSELNLSFNPASSMVGLSKRIPGSLSMRAGFAFMVLPVHPNSGATVPNSVSASL